MKTVERFNLCDEELAKGGHLLCPGCPGGIVWRIITKVLGKSSLLVHSASCFVLPAITYPASLAVASLYVSFASASAAAAGVSAGLRVRERRGVPGEKVHLFVVAGDGGTADIGFASLSSAAERNEDIIYFCFDNEAYMNTGIQRSSQTPQGTWTTSTPLGKPELKKDMPRIMAAHGIPYVATASASFPEDLAKKTAKARDMGKGFKYIHVQVPSPTGWRFPESKAVHVGRLAVETGMWRLFEIEDGGRERITYRPKARRPVVDYLSFQGRFSRLAAPEIDAFQKDVDEQCGKFRF